MIRHYIYIRYRRVAAVLMTALTVGGTAMAQTTIGGSVYGGGALANTGNTVVNLTGGVVRHNVYGGGMGDADTEAKVGSTEVNLNKDVENTDKGCVVEGDIFGCNNINGTPLGNATVHIYKTQNAEATTIANPAEGDQTAKVAGRYDVNAVYGGGNLAAYVPTASGASAKVIIDGCELTSIRTVYGGGNAASVPATDVLVNGTYEIEEVFGGGNGLDEVNGKANPGANVGYKNYTLYDSDGEPYDNPAYNTKEKRTVEGSAIVYGSGAANVKIYGGTIHRVFGGSNTKGNVRHSAVTMLDDNSGCDFNIDEAYGGGKSAPMDAEAKLLMACIPGLRMAYGGAENANVEGDVALTITNGTFDRVFGGNNRSGTIAGRITVNIEETGCKPIVIGQLYGGGNLAPYAGQNGSGPTVNVRSFTSIGDIYGGGYGSTAVVTGNTTVNINVCEGNHKNTIIGENATTETWRSQDDDAGGDYPIPSHAAGKMGAINNVFGGGNAAQVEGDTYVNIATRVAEDEYMAIDVKDDTGFPTGYYTRSGEGTATSPYTYSAATGTTPVEGTTYYKKYTIKGVDIRGNIYGGGNNANVTGSTNVVIGKEKEDENEDEDEDEDEDDPDTPTPE